MNYIELFEKVDENLEQVIDFITEDYNEENDTRIKLTDDEKNELINKIKDTIYSVIESNDI